MPLSELEKLLAANAKRKARINAADQVLAAPAASAEPIAPPPPPEPEPAAAAPAASLSAAAADNGAPASFVEPTSIKPVFSHAPTAFIIEPLKSPSDDDDPIVSMLAGLSAEEPSARELLAGGWVRAHYERRPCPAPVVRWLFAVTCHHHHADVASAASRTLISLLGTAPTDAASAETCMEWVPLPSDFLAALQRHGADLEELGAPQAGTGGEPESTAAPEPDGSREPAEMGDARQNLLAALELLPACARLWATRLAVRERIGAVRWMLRLTLDVHAAAAFVHLQDGIAALLDGAADADWQSAWLPGLLSEIQALCGSLPHTAVVRVVEYLPPTLRAATLQRVGAVLAIRLLVRRGRLRAKATEKRKRQERREQRKRQKVEAAEVAAGDDDDEEEEEEEEEEDEDDEDDEAAGTAEEDHAAILQAEGASALRSALDPLDGIHYRGHMAALHSLLVLVNVCVAAEPARFQGDTTGAVRAVKSKLNVLKTKANKYRGIVDYHGLECESLAGYLANKLEHLFLANDRF